MGLSNSHKKARKRKDEGGMLSGNKEGINGTRYGHRGPREGNSDEICVPCRKKWRSVVYMSGDIERKLRDVEHWIENKRKGVKTILRRDFNARTGEDGEGVVEGEEMEKEGRERR